MVRALLAAVLLIAFRGLAAAVDLNLIDGYCWSNRSYQEKAEIIISMSRSLSSEDEIIIVSPETALNLCLLTDEYYSVKSNMRNAIFTAWLDIAKHAKAEKVTAN